MDVDLQFKQQKIWLPWGTVQVYKKLYGIQSNLFGNTDGCGCSIKDLEAWGGNGVSVKDMEAQCGSGRFWKEHGIHNLSLKGKKLSADKEAGDSFISFAVFTEEYQLTVCVI